MSKSAQNSPEFIDIKEVCHILNISKRTVQNSIILGRIPKPTNYRHKNLYIPRHWRRSEILALSDLRQRRPKTKKRSNKIKG